MSPRYRDAHLLVVSNRALVIPVDMFSPLVRPPCRSRASRRAVRTPHATLVFLRCKC